VEHGSLVADSGTDVFEHGGAGVVAHAKYDPNSTRQSRNTGCRFFPVRRKLTFKGALFRRNCVALYIGGFFLQSNG
jgi:hypothetical protein